MGLTRRDRLDAICTAPGEPTADLVPALNTGAGYEHEGGSDVLPLPAENADLRSEDEDASVPRPPGDRFAEGDRVTWVTERGRRRAGPSSASATTIRPPKVEVPGRALPVRVNLEELASAADLAAG